MSRNEAALPFLLKEVLPGIARKVSLTRSRSRSVCPPAKINEIVKTEKSTIIMVEKREIRHFEK